MFHEILEIKVIPDYTAFYKKLTPGDTNPKSDRDASAMLNIKVARWIRLPDTDDPETVNLYHL